ncbi:MAG: PASTA domain-containing protein [Muribaculaceae bacterium]
MLIFLAGVVLVIIGLIFLDFWTRHGETSTVPEIKDMPYQQAAEILDRNDLEIEISDSIYDRGLAPGTVVESWPKAGSVVKRGRQVFVTVTAFSPKMVTLKMPVTGVSSRQATSYLEAVGVTAVRIVNVPSQYPDLVERALVDGKPLSVGSVIPVTSVVTLEVGAVPVEEPVDSLDAAIDREIDNLDL